MAGLAWVMMAIAIWHFTVFLPDRFWGGIVGAFLFSILGAMAFGMAIHGLDVPGQDDTSLLTALEAVPGTALGLGVCWLLGVRSEGDEHRSDAFGRSAQVRSARPDDAPRIAAIYNEGIEDRVATFETRPRSAEDVTEWFVDGLPFLVAERDGSVAGFARVAPYSDRCVYEGVGEHGVYVARSARGSGLGRDLLDMVCFAAGSVGLYKLTARILADNAASLAAHRAAGFREVGVQRRHGRLDGEWRDVVIVERLLGEAAEG